MVLILYCFILRWNVLLSRIVPFMPFITSVITGSMMGIWLFTFNIHLKIHILKNHLNGIMLKSS